MRMFMTRSRGDGEVLICSWNKRKMNSDYLKSHGCVYSNRRAYVSNMNDLPMREYKMGNKGTLGPGLNKFHQPERGGVSL